MMAVGWITRAKVGKPPRLPSQKAAFRQPAAVWPEPTRGRWQPTKAGRLECPTAPLFVDIAAPEGRRAPGRALIAEDVEELLEAPPTPRLCGLRQRCPGVSQVELDQ